jgi:hypothetical protein
VQVRLDLIDDHDAAGLPGLVAGGSLRDVDSNGQLGKK